MTVVRRLAPLLIVAGLALSSPACGTKDNGGVITPSGDTPSTTIAP